MRTLVVLDRAIYLLFVLALMLAGCKSCQPTPPPEPAGRRELELVDKALTNGGAYQQAMAELEKTPDASLRAVREQSAPPHSRKAVFLVMMADHLQQIDTYRRWQRVMDEAPSKGVGPGGIVQQTEMPHIGYRYPDKITGLDGSEQVHFWAEQLLAIGADTAEAAAVAHLERIASPEAIDALALYVRTPQGGLALMQAAIALGKLGRARELAEALAAYQHPDIAPTAILGGVATIKAGFASLPPPRRSGAETELLNALEKESLTTDQRAGYISALAAFGTNAAADRLAQLRQTEWGKQMSAEIDAAIAAISNRDTSDVPPGKTGSPRWSATP